MQYMAEDQFWKYKHCPSLSEQNHTHRSDDTINNDHTLQSDDKINNDHTLRSDDKINNDHSSE